MFLGLQLRDLLEDMGSLDLLQRALLFKFEHESVYLTVGLIDLFLQLLVLEGIPY